MDNSIQSTAARMLKQERACVHGILRKFETRTPNCIKIQVTALYKSHTDKNVHCVCVCKGRREE